MKIMNAKITIKDYLHMHVTFNFTIKAIRSGSSFDQVQHRKGQNIERESQFIKFIYKTQIKLKIPSRNFINNILFRYHSRD